MFNSFLGMGASTAVDESAVLEEMRHTPLVECVDDPLDACIRITYESTVNFNNITKALAMDELKYFQENGVEMVYEAGKVVEFFKAAKDWIVNTWAKIMGVIKSAINRIDTLPAYAWYKANKKAIDALGSSVTIKTLKDKIPEGTKIPEFPQTYRYFVGKTGVEENIGKVLDNVLKTEGLKLDHEGLMDVNVIKNALHSVDAAEAAKTAAQISTKEFKNKFYLEILNLQTDGAKLTSIDGFEDFSKKCINLFRTGKSNLEPTVKVSEYADRIANTNKAKAEIKAVYNGVEHSYKDWIKAIENARKTAEKQNKDNKEEDFSAALGVMRYGVAAIKDAASATNLVLRAHLSAIRADAYRSQKVLEYVLTLNRLANKKAKSEKDNKEEVQHNSAVTTESFLASLKMI